MGMACTSPSNLEDAPAGPAERSTSKAEPSESLPPRPRTPPPPEESPEPRSSLRLYGAKGNGNTHKGKMVLALTGAEWSFHEVQLPVDDQAFRKLQASGQVPILVDSEAQLDTFSTEVFRNPEVLEAFGPPGLVVRDITAILVYVAVRSGVDSWMPVRDAAALAKVQRWLAYSTSEIATSLAWVRVARYFGWSIPVPLEDAFERSHRVLTYLDRELAAAKAARQKWLASMLHPTIADIAVFPYVALIEESSHGAISLHHYQNVAAWIARVKALPGYPKMDKPNPMPVMMSRTQSEVEDPGPVRAPQDEPI